MQSIKRILESLSYNNILHIDILMEDVIDLIATGGSQSDVSDKMKQILYAKAAERIDIARPYVANAMFGQELEILK